MDNEYSKTITDQTLREVVNHGSEEYPFQYYYEDIWDFDLHCIDWHWHPEVEFVFVEKGTAIIFIGSEIYTLHAGSGIFINTRVIHRFEAKESTIIPNIVFLPTLLAAHDSLIFRKYIKPVLDSSVECIILSSENKIQKEIIDVLVSVFSIQNSKKNSEIITVELIIRLWRIMFDNICLTDKENISEKSIQIRGRLQIMMHYIQRNYRYRITLDDIAQTVSMSKSSVLNIFKEYLHTSPVSYLINYRLRQATRLLSNTEDSIASIANETGFEDAGYFCRKFKNLFGMTPNEYRKKGQFFSE